MWSASWKTVDCKSWTHISIVGCTVEKKDAYRLLWPPDKTVLLIVLSDSNRNPELSAVLGHTGLIRYGISEFSLVSIKIWMSKWYHSMDNSLNLKLRELVGNHWLWMHSRSISRTHEEHRAVKQTQQTLDVNRLPPVHSDKASDYYIIGKYRNGIHMERKQWVNARDIGNAIVRYWSCPITNS